MEDLKKTFLNEKTKCEICDKEFKNNKYLKQHFIRVHTPNEFEYQCNICQKVFRLKSNLT